MKRLLISGSIIVLALCGASSCTAAEDDGPMVVDCRADLAGEWESVAEFGCPLVDPACTYRHTLSLDGSKYEWYPSDQMSEGTYTCKDGDVETVDLFGESAFTATYDIEADTLELSWAGQTTPEPYQRAMP